MLRHGERPIPVPGAVPLPHEGAAEIAPLLPQAALLRRMEGSRFRQSWGITTLRLRIERQAREEKSRETSLRTREVYERKAG
jgi:hypothetical protein